MQNMDELLRDTFAELVEEEYRNRPAEFPRHRFSWKFRVKMYRMIHQTGGKKRAGDNQASLWELYRPVHSKRRLIVLVMLLLMLLGGTVVAAGSLIRWLHQVVLEQHDDHYEIYKPESETVENVPETTSVGEKDFRRYMLTELPEGYELVKKEYKEVYELYREAYENSEGEALLFKQCGGNQGHIGNVTSAEEQLEEITINGFKGYYIQDEDTGNLILSDGETLVELSGRMSKEELMYFAEKLEPIE